MNQDFMVEQNSQSTIPVIIRIQDWEEVPLAINDLLNKTQSLGWFVQILGLTEVLTVKDCRTLIENAYQHGGNKKLFLICNPEKASIAASNSLLKLLEEPPVETIFIFFSKNTDAILPTISSRCLIENSLSEFLINFGLSTSQRPSEGQKECSKILNFFTKPFDQTSISNLLDVFKQEPESVNLDIFDKVWETAQKNVLQQSQPLEFWQALLEACQELFQYRPSVQTDKNFWTTVYGLTISKFVSQ